MFYWLNRFSDCSRFADNGILLISIIFPDVCFSMSKREFKGVRLAEGHFERFFCWWIGRSFAVALARRAGIPILVAKFLLRSYLLMNWQMKGRKGWEEEDDNNIPVIQIMTGQFCVAIFLIRNISACHFGHPFYSSSACVSLSAWVCACVLRHVLVLSLLSDAVLTLCLPGIKTRQDMFTRKTPLCSSLTTRDKQPIFDIFDILPMSDFNWAKGINKLGPRVASKQMVARFMHANLVNCFLHLP